MPEQTIFALRSDDARVEVASPLTTERNIVAVVFTSDAAPSAPRDEEADDLDVSAVEYPGSLAAWYGNED